MKRCSVKLVREYGMEELAPRETSPPASPLCETQEAFALGITSREPSPAAADLPLPDTQEAADVLTPSSPSSSSSRNVSSQGSTQPYVWGRLSATYTPLPSLDMTEHRNYTLGRDPSCDVCLTKKNLPEKWLSVISKEHFSLYQEPVEGTNEMAVFLKDTSRSGTWVDGQRVGRGKRVIVGNLSTIALVKHNFTVYTFTGADDENDDDNDREGCELPAKLKEIYAIGRKLGKGAYSQVRLLFRKDGSAVLALKIVRKYRCTGNEGACNKLAIVRNEIEMMRRLEHPCVIHLEDIHNTPATTYIVLEFMAGGDLWERVTSRGKLMESCAQTIFHQVALAIHYLHEEGITHRDLKPHNILLSVGETCGECYGPWLD